MYEQVVQRSAFISLRIRISRDFETHVFLPRRIKINNAGFRLELKYDDITRVEVLKEFDSKSVDVKLRVIPVHMSVTGGSRRNNMYRRSFMFPLIELTGTYVLKIGPTKYSIYYPNVPEFAIVTLDKP
jgi:hypothetical protein